MESSKKKQITYSLRAIVVIFLIDVLVGVTAVKAQTFAEWFSQKKTQIKYLNEQITALLQYGSYVKQGYEISQNGLGNLNSYLKNEYGLHSNYYNSLKSVNPEIKGSSTADSITSYATRIPRQFDYLIGLKELDESNRQYVAEIKEKVLDECNKDLVELQLIITAGKAQMTDDELLKRMDKIYVRMRDKYTFTESFCNQVRVLLLQRNQEIKDIQSLKQYYETN